MKKILFVLLTAITALATFTSCEKEEEMAAALSGSWEGDLGITHKYKGQTIKPVKSVFTFNQEAGYRTSGDGYLVETFDLPELKNVYRRLNWETWTRQNGDVGVQINLESEYVRYHIFEYNMSDQEFSGKYTLDDKTDIPFKLTRIATAPDVSKVKIWGYDELLPTWKPITYSGVLDIRREYKGKIYKPTNVTITFDVEPQYNTAMIGYEKSFLKEEYSDAPFGTYLADTIRSWYNNGTILYINFIDSDESFGDYQMWNVTATQDSLAGDIFVDTNVFTHFNLKRITNPDWSAIKEWGIINRLKK